MIVDAILAIQAIVALTETGAERTALLHLLRDTLPPVVRRPIGFEAVENLISRYADVEATPTTRGLSDDRPGDNGVVPKASSAPGRKTKG